jgi:hypothetical protein
MGICGVDLSDSAYRQVAVSCEKRHELSGSTKGGELLDKLTGYSLLKKGQFYKTKFITASVCSLF